MAHEVFISYSSLDKEVADSLCGQLEQSGTHCWIAPRDVMPGKPYGEALIDAINDSRVMVLVLSEHSNHSQQVAREVERAASKGIPIIPFRIANVRLAKSLEYFLSTCHWLDAFDDAYEDHVPRLTEAVNATLRQLYEGETLPLDPVVALPPKPRKNIRPSQAADQADKKLAEKPQQQPHIFEAELVTEDHPAADSLLPPRRANSPQQPQARQQHGQQRGTGPPHFDRHPPQPWPRPRRSNALGLLGFASSLLGVLTCGTFSPVALILSLIGLVKSPRGYAFAGSVISAIGTGVFLTLFSWGFYGGFVTAITLEEAAAEIDAWRADTGEPPDNATGMSLIAHQRDAWNRELQYSRNWMGYEIRSAGVDGEFHTLDDHTVLR